MKRNLKKISQRQWNSYYHISGVPNKLPSLLYGILLCLRPTCSADADHTGVLSHRPPVASDLATDAAMTVQRLMIDIPRHVNPEPPSRSCVAV
ncbi:hypothetical protein ACP70R_005671 [Stipagrostis hirtigluma subsp. patula]